MMNRTQAARLLLVTSFVAVLMLPMMGCQSTAQDSGEQEALPSPTEGAQPGEDAETVAATATPEEAATAPPTAEPEVGPTPTRAPTGDSAGSDPEAIELVRFAREDLGTRLGLPAGEIAVKSVEAEEWPDAGLGCPLPGASYAQVVTPGYLIVLEGEGEAYQYHTDMDRAVVLCRDEGLRDLPAIPVNPDEILDGKPWMPNLDE